MLQAETNRDGVCVAEQNKKDWLIVGAGPAGLIAASVFLDIGVDPKSIVLLDPTFEVGRMGQFYSKVESNNKAREFVAFINASITFQQCKCPSIDALKQMNP